MFTKLTAVILVLLSTRAFCADIVDAAIANVRGTLADYHRRFSAGQLRTGESERLFGPIALTHDQKQRKLFETDLNVEAGRVSFRMLTELKVGNAGCVPPSRDPERSSIQVVTRHPDGSFLGTLPKGSGRSIPLLFKGFTFHPDGHMLPLSGPLIVTGRHEYASGLHVKQSFVVQPLEKLVAARRLTAK